MKQLTLKVFFQMENLHDIFKYFNSSHFNLVSPVCQMALVEYCNKQTILINNIINIPFELFFLHY